MSKDILSASIREIESRDKDNILGGELKKKPNKYFKSGEFLFKLLQLGYSVIEIETITLLKSVTIEKRVIEYIKASGNKQEHYELLYNDVKGLKNIGIFKMFVKSNYEVKEFCKLLKISTETLKVILRELSEIDFFNAKLKERVERLKEIQILKNSSSGVKHVPTMGGWFQKTHYVIKLG